ncbi:hypothetical protein MOMMJLID_CDS0056 [Arthrobacter phage 1191A]|nr:hypothetical protein MOMMJLID_CDS0056 [Arthrobacter phage 1191A]
MAWHETIGDLDMQDCLTAITEYFKTSKEWIMPADVRNGVKAIRNVRLDGIRQDVRLREEHEALDDVKLWAQRKNHLTNLIASGQLTPEQYHAYHDGTFVIGSMPKEIAK